jgi:hypothetical protein
VRRQLLPSVHSPELVPTCLPGADWRVADGAAASAEDADVELDEVA